MEHIQGNGVTLAVRQWGERGWPTVLLVHGYPDNSHVWDGVAERLAGRYHVVAYDVRGAGDSDIPRRTRDYRLEYLIDDLAAVADAVSPGEAVHLVGHDWGSIQGWEAVTEPRLQSRFASFTSISGPCLDHVGMRLRGGGGGIRKTLDQLRRSWYIGLFHLPLLASLGWRRGLGRRWPAMLQRREGVTLSEDPAVRTRDGIHGIKLYRANILRRLLRPRERRTGVPVQVIVPLRDPFVGPNLTLGLERWAPNLTRIEVEAGHWLPLARPDDLAGYVDDFISPST